MSRDSGLTPQEKHDGGEYVTYTRLTRLYGFVATAIDRQGKHIYTDNAATYAEAQAWLQTEMNRRPQWRKVDTFTPSDT